MTATAHDAAVSCMVQNGVPDSGDDIRSGLGPVQVELDPPLGVGAVRGRVGEQLALELQNAVPVLHLKHDISYGIRPRLRREQSRG